MKSVFSCFVGGQGEEEVEMNTDPHRQVQLRLGCVRLPSLPALDRPQAHLAAELSAALEREDIRPEKRLIQHYAVCVCVR